uniref:Tumor necrosis factor receptor superfamily member 5 n=1 Tax=Gopherus agassizii TaxID=38772 RepID=A0A452IDA9_9SAUR
TAKQYQHDDRCCNRCEPGLKLLSDCTASQNSVCEPCEERHFQSGWTREKHCTPHKSCDHNAGLETRSRGDAKHNAECQCQQGMYCSSPDCQTCLNITACRPGEGVARKADNLSDTTCEPCKHGTFSSISSASEPCRPWTSCESLGLVLKVPGTNRLDVACGKCQAVSIPRRGIGLPWPHAVPARGAAAGPPLTSPSPTWQGPERLDPVEIVVLAPPQQPAAVGCEEHDERQDFPVQETLLGRQPVAQEDGKESRISEQERL